MNQVLKQTVAFLALVVFAVAGSGRADAEEVVVTSQTAPVKVKDRLIGKVSEGERFQVLDRQSGWVAIAIATEQGTQRGWVLSNHLQSLTSQDDLAPGEPAAFAPGVELKIDSIQLSLQSSVGYLFAHATIKNSGESEFSYDDSAVRLLVNDREAVGAAGNAPAPYANHRIYSGFSSETSMRYQYSHNLNLLGKGTLVPGEQVEGWLRFPLTTLRRGADLSDVRFVLKGSLKGSEFEFDLRQQSLANLSPRVRTSTFDETVKVVDVSGGLNSLNLTALQDLLGIDGDSGPQAVVVFRNESFFIDQNLLDQLRGMSSSSSRSKSFPLVFVRPPVKRGQPSGGYTSSMYVSNLPMAQSEKEGVIWALSERPNAVETLTPLLKHDDHQVRVAVANGLASHLADEKAVDALVAAADDSDAAVRAACVSALGGYSARRSSVRYSRAPSVAAPVKPEVVSVVVAAMSDDATPVRINAARTSARIQDPKVIEGLIELLQDEENAVVSAACGSLGTLKAKPAIDALQELRQSDDRTRRGLAIRALGSIGELTAVESALAQLNEGTPSYADFEALTKEKDERAVEPLIRYLRSQDSNSSFVDRAARALGMLRDKRATEVLVALLRYGNTYSSEIPQALGELGDPAAIEPLREAKLATNVSGGRLAAIYGALLRLKADGVLDELVGLLQQANPSKIDMGQALTALAQSKSQEATSVIAKYLDDRNYHRQAAVALLEQGTPAAFDAIEKSLAAKDYPHASTVLSVLLSNRSDRAIELIRGAASSRNENARKLAEGYLRSLDSGASQRERLHQALIGKPLVPFTAEHWINGSELNPGDLKNKVVLLDFWAVWCAPCIATFPHLNQWKQEYGDDGLEVVGITRHYQYGWDEENERPYRDATLSSSDENQALEQFVKHHKLKYRVAVVPADSKVMADYRVSAIPHAVLIGRTGKIRLVKVGSSDTNARAMEEEIQRCLKELDFSGQAITNADLESYLQDAAEVTSLNLQGAQITDSGLVALKTLKNLESLRLDNTSITDEGLQLLAQQGNLAGLKVLGLSDTKITEAGLSELANLSGLQELSVATTGMNDQGLAIVGRTNSLLRLQLGDGWGAASITDGGLQQLVGLTELQRLDLHGTAITDKGLQSLQDLPGLQSIGLVETKVTQEGVGKLRESRPEVSVRIDQWSPWLTRSAYQAYYSGMVQKEFFPLQVEGKVGEEEPVYRGRFVPYPTGREFTFRSMHATPYTDYARRRSEAERDGMTQVSLFSFQGGEIDERFNGTWVLGRVESYWKTPMIVATRSLSAASRARRDGDLKAAANSYRAAIDALPEHVRANVLLAIVLREMEDEPGATEAFEQTVELIRSIPEERRTGSDWGFLGQSLYRLGQWQASREALTQVIELRREQEPVIDAGPRWWYLTMALHQLGEEEKAREYYRLLAAQLTSESTPSQLAFRDETAKLLGIAEGSDD